MAVISVSEAITKMDKLDANSEKVAKQLVRDFESRGKPWITKPVTQKYNIKAKEFKGYISKGPIENVDVGGRVVEARAFEVSSAMLGPSRERFAMSPKQPKTANITRKRKSSGQPYTVTSGNYTLKATIMKGRRVTLGKYLNRKGTTASMTDRSPNMLFPNLGGHAGYRKGRGIYKLKTISAAQMVENEEVSKQIQKNIQDNMEKRYEHYKDRFLK